MFAAKSTTELRSELWKRGIKMDAKATHMELIHRLEEYEAQQRRVKRKSPFTALAMLFCVAIRIGELGFSGYIAYYFWTSLDDSSFRLGVVAAFLILASLSSAGIAYYRQAFVEQKHNPIISFFLGLSHMQLLVEWWDGVMDGKKTDAIKMLLNVGAIMNSVPLGFYFCYLGYFTEWTYPLAIAVWLSMMNMGLTIISAEKEIYLSRGLGKLDIFAPYSIVLFLFRCVELPARIFSYTLFASRFKLFVFIVVGIDIIILYLIRASTIKRMVLKQDRSRDVLQRALAQLSKGHGEIERAAVDIAAEAEATKVRFTWQENVFHFIAWQLVYLEGIDAVPFFCLRILEIAAMTALFLLLDGGVDDLNTYQASGLWVAAGFCLAYCLLSPIWQYYRSHASFLHPVYRQPTQLQLAVMRGLMERPLAEEGGERHDEPTGGGVINSASSADREEKQPASAPNESVHSQDDKLENQSESESESTTDADEADDKPAPEPIVIVKEVAPPPREMRTIETQWQWEESFQDLEQPALSPARKPASEAPAKMRACVGPQHGNPKECTVM